VVTIFQHKYILTILVRIEVMIYLSFCQLMRLSLSFSLRAFDVSLMECQLAQIIEDSRKTKIQEKIQNILQKYRNKLQKITSFNLFPVAKEDDLKEFLKAVETTLSEASLCNAIKL
jgi:hypothetical protein